MLNIPLMRKVMDHIDSIPNAVTAREVFTIIKSEDGPKESYHQGKWMVEGACGTAGCFAGHAVLMVGAKPVNLEPLMGDTGIELTSYVEFEDKVHEISALAQEQLGLTDDQADELFAGFNTIDDVHEFVDEFISEAEAEQFGE